MKVDETAIWTPPPNRASYGLVIHRLIVPKPLCQPVAGAHIISGKHVYSSETGVTRRTPRFIGRQKVNSKTFFLAHQLTVW